MSSSKCEDSDATAAAAIVFGMAAVAMLLVCLVAAAGFIVIAQRRSRQLGLLAAVGATNKHLRLVMLANGVLVGVSAAAIGSATALVAWFVARPELETSLGHRIDGTSIPPWLVLTGIVLAIVTATAAAWWPARSVARQSVTEALSARPAAPQAGAPVGRGRARRRRARIRRRLLRRRHQRRQEQRGVAARGHPRGGRCDHLREPDHAARVRTPRVASAVRATARAS